MHFARSDMGRGKASSSACRLFGGSALLFFVACSSDDNVGSPSNTPGSGSGGNAAVAGAATTGGAAPTSGGTSGGSAAGGVTSMGGAGGALNAGNGSVASNGGTAPGGIGGAGGTSGAGAKAGNDAGGVSGGKASAGAGAGGVATAGAGGLNPGGNGGAGANLAYPSAAGSGDIAQGIDQLNRYRVALGLGMVTLDEPSSVGCSGHLDYLIEEAELRGQAGYLEHTESNESNSHYSAANEQAGKQSDLAWGQRGGRGNAVGQSLGQAVDLWINGLYHRRPLLDPGLVKVGAASKDGYNCLNYAASGNTTVLEPASAVLWPASGMRDVPRTFPGNEGPCPTAPADPLGATSCSGSGFIVSATFYNWGTNRMSAIGSVTSVTLTNTSTEMPVPLLTWYADRVPEHDPARGYVPDEIALVPASTLAANTTFRVDIDAVVSGSASKLSWSFTTGSRNE